MTKTKRNPQTHLHEARSFKKAIEFKEILKDLQEEEEGDILEFLNKEEDNEQS